MGRVVLSGGAGFIGSHLSRALLDRGDAVVCVDNLLTGSTANIADLEGRSDFEFLKHDVIIPFEVDGPVDAVMHFASPASPADFARIPLEILSVGSNGTRNMLDLAVQHRARFMVASTSEVYGDPLVHPQPETYWGNVNTIGPRSVYDEAKRFGEAITMAYHRVHALDVRILRIFNTYGTAMRPDDGRAVSNLLVQAIRGEPLTVYGDGSQTRSFCYVEDEVRGILALLDCDYVGPVNIGNPNEFTILELAQNVIEATGSQSPIEFLPLPQDDPMQRKPDITLAKRILGWEPTIQLPEGLARTAAYFRERLDAPSPPG
ncbi:MAG: SDR family oxidoreductase [Actinobacteria bacterium]|nr:SDR family oxidoreductase [Actinomycetota bacterium]